MCPAADFAPALAAPATDRRQPRSRFRRRIDETRRAPTKAGTLTIDEVGACSTGPSGPSATVRARSPAGRRLGRVQLILRALEAMTPATDSRSASPAPGTGGPPPP